MTLISALCGIRDRRAVLVLAIATLSWTACSGTGPSPSSDGASGAGSTAASGHNGGKSGGGCNEGRTPGNCSSGGAAGEAGASDPQHLAGAAGISDAAGSAGMPNSAGVGSTEDEAGSAGAGGDRVSGFEPAAHAPFPLVTPHGGRVLKNIEIVPVYFGEDPLFDDLERFNSWVVASDYWKHVGAEYGVEAGTRLPALKLPSPSDSLISDTQIAGWVDSWIADHTLPKPNQNTVFVFFFQAGTTIKNWAGTSCRVFAGLHKTATVANAEFTGEVPFVVLPRCTYSPEDDPFMIVTDVASHEYIETATNPFNSSNPGWIMDNDAGPLEAWGMLSGPAVADLCLNQSYDVAEGFTVQDIWSNVAAQAGMNPCQPSDPARPFFSVSTAETIYHAQPGSTLTIHARAWSNLPAPNWEVSVNWGFVPYSDFDGKAVLSTDLVNNGDELTASVTVPANPPVTDGRSVYRFMIDSIDPINPNFAHSWPILVVVP